MANRPMLQLCVIFTLGVLIGAFVNISLMPLLILLAVVLVVTAFCYYRLMPITRWLLVLLCLLLGLFHINMWDKSQQTNLVPYIDQTVIVTGQVVREPDIRADKVIYLIKTRALELTDQQQPAKGLLRLTVYEPEVFFQYGDIISARGKLEAVKSPGNPGQFDYQQYLNRRGIQVLMSVWQAENVNRLGQVDSGLMGWALAAKTRLMQVLAKTLPPEQTGLVQGMLFGSLGMIEQDTSADFQTTSLIHILSVSGFHVGLVMGAFLFLLHSLKVPLKLQAPLCTVAIIFYAAISGFGPAVLRAMVMGLMVLWARHFGRERDWPTAMALALVVILFIWPRAMWEPGFQLSFAVTWGILYLTPGFEKLLRDKLPAGCPRSLAVAIAVPLVAELTAVPLVVYHFNMVSLVGVLTNILAAPLITGIMLFSAVSVLVGLVFTPLAAIINVTTSLLLDSLLWLVNLLASLPHAAWYLPTPPWWWIILFYLLLAYLPRLLQLEESKPKYLYAAGVTLSILVLLFADASHQSDQLTVHFIDVGQGDAALVQTPSGKNMLIDTGGWAGEFITANGAGSKVVLPYLQRLGINSLDVLLLSHPHEDHCGGARVIVEKLPIELVLISPPIDHEQQAESEPEATDIAYDQLLADMHKRGLVVKSALAGQVLQLDRDLQVSILSPVESTDNLNNNSVVVKINYQSASLLFTGDIEQDQQQMLVDSGYNLTADVLKVPHHGSANFSPEFMQAVAPKIAVISVGEKNRFGHPAPVTIQQLADIGAKVYRTDTNGAVIINTNGESLWVDTGRKSE